MAELTLPQIQAEAMRICLLEPNGVPHPGPDAVYVTQALTKIEVKPDYKDGTEITQENAAGVLCVDYIGPKTFRRAMVTIELCSPDPFAAFLLGNGDLLEGLPSGVPGYAAPPIGEVKSRPISVEFWAKRIVDGDQDPDFPWAWWALPKLRDMAQTDFSAENKAMVPSFEGQALENLNWFDGPGNDWPATSDRVWQWVPTKTIPDPTVGLAALAAS